MDKEAIFKELSDAMVSCKAGMIMTATTKAVEAGVSKIGRASCRERV